MRAIMAASFGLGLLLLPAGAEEADTSAAATVSIVKDIKVSTDGSSVQTIHVEMHVNSAAAVMQAGTATYPFDATMEDVQVEEAHTLKADGRTVPVDKTEIYEQSPPADQAASMITGRRSKVIVFPQFAAGDTAVYTIRQTTKQPLFPGHFQYGDLFPATIRYGDVRETITAPKAMPLQVESHDVAFSKTESGTAAVYSWHYSAPSADATETYAGPFAMEHMPRFFASSFKDYESLGNAYAALTAEKRSVTAKVAALAAKITAGAGDKTDQARRIYEWVTTNIRYVGIELGSGSFVPHDVDSIIDRGYGDCKDHDVLLQSLLEAKGIASESVLINGDTIYTLTKVPTFVALNHVITYLPESKTYLDSTAVVAPFGVLPLGEYGKPVVIAAPGHSSMGEIPPLQPGIGKINTHTVESLDKDGNLTGTTTTTASGPYVIALRIIGIGIQALGPSAATRLLASLGYDSAQGSVSQNSPVALTPSHTITGTFKASGWARYFAGDDSFVLPGGLRVFGPSGDGIVGSFYNKGEKEEGPALCYSAEAAEDISLKAPPGLRFEKAPGDTSIKTPHLSFTAHWTLDGDTIRVQRDFRSTIDQPFCDGDVRAETAAALKRIAASYDKTFISFRQTGPAADIYDEASRYYDAGKYPEALAAYDKLAALKPNEAYVYYDRGLVYNAMGDFTKAIQDYNKAISLSPDGADYYAERGRSHMNAGDQKEALSDFENAVRLDPDNAKNFAGRGHVYLMLGKPDDAATDLTKAISLDERQASPHADLAAIFLEKKQYDRALAEMERAIAIEPKNGVFLASRGFIHLAMAKPELALKDEDAALAISAADARARFLRARANFAMKKYAEAVKDCDAIIARDPKYAAAFLLRGNAKNNMGNTLGGNRDIEQAVKLEPRLVGAP